MPAVSGRVGQQALLPNRADEKTGSSVGAPRFADVLHVDRNGKAFSSEQMLEANRQTPQGERRTYLRGQFKDAVQNSARQRTEARSGVKARGASSESTDAATHQHQGTPVPPVVQNVRNSEAADASAVEQFHSAPIERKANLQADSRSNSELSNRFGAERPSFSTNQNATTQPGALPPAAAMNNLNQSGVAPIGEPAQELARMLATANAAKLRADSGSSHIQSLARPESVSQGPTTVASRPDRPDATARTTTTPNAKQADSAPSTTFERLMRAFRAQPGRQSTARVLLDPPDLGRVHVQVSVAGDRVEIGVQTENEKARQLVSQRAAQLKSALEQQGMIVDRFDISTNSSGLFDSRATAAGEHTLARTDQGGDAPAREISSRSRGRASKDQRATSVRKYADHLSEMGFDIQA